MQKILKINPTAFSVYADSTCVTGSLILQEFYKNLLICHVTQMWIHFNNFANRYVDVLSGRCVEERAEPKDKILNLLVNPHLWSQALGNDWKNEIVNTSS